MEEEKKILITVDMREHRSGVTDALARMKGVEIVSVDLFCGDYVVGAGYGIERKSAVDFVNSIMSSHIFGQLEKMKAEYEKSILLIEGDVYSTRSEISEVALDGFISYVTLLSDVKIVYTKNIQHTAAMIYRMAIHAQHGLGYIPPLRSGKPKDLTPLAIYMIEGCPGIGAQSARTLLNHFKSPLNVFNASKEQLKEVKGMGPKTIDRIHDVLRLGISDTKL